VILVFAEDYSALLGKFAYLLLGHGF